MRFNLVILWSLACLSGADLANAASPQSSGPVMLESVRFRLFGNEKQDVAEITLEDEQYRLRLFNQKLASYYSVKIPSEDLISSQPLGISASEEILQQRQELIRLRERDRQERRLKAQAKKQKERAPSDGVSSAGDSGSETLTEEIPSNLSLSGYRDLLTDFAHQVKEMQDRNDLVLSSGQGFVGRLRFWAEESDSKPRVFHALKSESHSIVENAESLKKRLASRMKEIIRTQEQAQQGHLRVRDLPEIIDRIRQRLLRCEENIGELESLKMACSDGLISLGEPRVDMPKNDVAKIDVPKKTKLIATEERIKSSPSLERVSASVEEVAIAPGGYREPASEARASGSESRRGKMPIGEPSPFVRNTPAKTVTQVAKSSEMQGTEEAYTDPQAGSAGAREMILGAILGALLVLGLGRLLKALP